MVPLGTYRQRIIMQEFRASRAGLALLALVLGLSGPVFGQFVRLAISEETVPLNSQAELTVVLAHGLPNLTSFEFVVETNLPIISAQTDLAEVTVSPLPVGLSVQATFMTPLVPGTYQLVRIRFDGLGQPPGSEPVVFLPGSAQVDGTALAPDQLSGGGVFFADFNFNRLFVANRSPSNSITAINPLTATISTVVSLPAEPNGITVANDGRVWFTTTTPPGLGYFPAVGTPSITPITPPGPGAPVELVATPEGDLWLTTDDPFTGLAKIDADGNPVIPVLDIPAPRAVATDRLGNLWVSTTIPGAGGQLFKLDPAGTIVFTDDLFVAPDPLPQPAASEPLALATDRLGFVWVTIKSQTATAPGPSWVERRAADGSVAERFFLPSSVSGGSDLVGVVARGEAEAWVIDRGLGRLYRLRANQPMGMGVSSFDLGTIPALMPPTIPTGIETTGNDLVWVIEETNQRAIPFDPDLLAPAVGVPTVPLDSMPQIRGNGSGYEQANTLLAKLDFDLDNLPNQFELDENSNPFSPNPLSTLVPPVLCLECRSEFNGSSANVTLNWINPFPYGSITIRRFLAAGGPLQFETCLDFTSGGVNTFTELSVGPGEYRYDVVASSASCGAMGVNATAACTVLVGAGGVTDSIKIRLGEPFRNASGLTSIPVPLPCAPVFYTADEDGTIFALDEKFDVVEEIKLVDPIPAPLNAIAFYENGDGGSGSLLLGFEKTTMALREVDLAGATIQNYSVFDFDSNAVDTVSGLDINDDTIFMTDVTSCFVYGAVLDSTSSSITALKEYSFEYQQEDMGNGELVWGLNGISLAKGSNLG